MEHFPCNTDWKPLYEAALAETDAGKLPERIQTARDAILDRIEETLTHSLPSECRAIDDALRELQKLALLGACQSGRRQFHPDIH